MKNSLKFFTVLVLAAALTFGGLTWAVRAQTSTPQPTQTASGNEPTRTVSVTGSGEVNVAPDVAVVVLGVETQADTAQAALSQNNTQMQALINTLNQAGIQSTNIQTQGLQLYPRYSQTNQTQTQQTIVGYTAVNTVQVRVQNLDNLGAMLDAAIQAGGNTIQNLSFEVGNPTPALDQARQQAMADARQKAEQLAQLVGATLGPVLSINETTQTPVPVLQAREAAPAAGAVPVQPGVQTVNVNVSVTWTLNVTPGQ